MKGLIRYAVPIASVSGAVAFLLSFLVLRGTHLSSIVAIGVPAVLFVVIYGAVWYAIDGRSRKQMQLDAYTFEAEGKAHAAMSQANAIRLYVQQIEDREVAKLLSQSCDDVGELFRRIRDGNPDSLESSATLILEHLNALNAMLKQYVDIQNNPRFHDNPADKLANAKQAIAGFDDFLVNSIRLIERGDNMIFEVNLKQLDAARFNNALS